MKPVAAHDVWGITVTAPGHVELLPADAVWSSYGGRPFIDKSALEPDEVFGRTICTLVSPGTEISGTFMPANPGTATPYPWIPGYAAVFEITAMGSRVTSLAVGDVVFSMGSHRSYQRERADRVWSIPSGLDPYAAVFARLMSIPMATLSTTRARPGSQVGVSGLGPIGYFAATAFASSGYSVTAWDPRAERRKLVPEPITVLKDAPKPVNPHQLGTTDGFDLVLECSGHDAAALADIKLVRSLGEVVLIGSPWIRHTDVYAHELLSEVFHRYVVLRSGWEWQIPADDMPFAIGSNQSRNIQLAMRWLLDGTVSVTRLARRFAPGQAQAVYESFAGGSAATLTALFDWSGFTTQNK